MFPDTGRAMKLSICATTRTSGRHMFIWYYVMTEILILFKYYIFIIWNQSSSHQKCYHKSILYEADKNDRENRFISGVLFYKNSSSASPHTFSSCGKMRLVFLDKSLFDFLKIDSQNHLTKSSIKLFQLYQIDFIKLFAMFRLP